MTIGSPRAASCGLALLGAALWLGALQGCHRAPARPRVDTIRVAESSLALASESGVAQPAIESLARTTLVESGFDVGPGENAWHARIELLGVSAGNEPSTGRMQLEARVEVALTPATGSEAARREVGTGRSPVVSGGPPAALQAALASAIGEAARGLRIGLTADAKPLEALLLDLESSDVRVRDHAVQALGERRERSAVPALIRRLQDADGEVAHRAVGALAQIKDPRAVAPIIELSRGGDPSLTLRLIRIVADIGGPSAQGWLATMEQAHPDPRVRNAAHEALAGLHLRDVAGAAAGPAAGPEAPAK